MRPVRVALLSLLAAAGFTGAASADGRLGRGDVVVVQSFEEVRDRGEARHGRGQRFDDVISERRLVRRLMRQGFVEIEDIDLRRDRYIVRAVRPNGAVIRLAVDAYDGEIIARERIGWARGEGPRGPRHGWRGPGRERGGPDGVEFEFGGGSLGIYAR